MAEKQSFQTLVLDEPPPPDPPDDDDWEDRWEPNQYRRFEGCIHCRHSYNDHYITGRPGCSKAACKCPDFAPAAW